MDYCYNNAVIHVFLGHLAQFKHKNRHMNPDKMTDSESLEFANIYVPMTDSGETPMMSE